MGAAAFNEVAQDVIGLDARALAEVARRQDAMLAAQAVLIPVYLAATSEGVLSRATMSTALPPRSILLTA